MPSTSTAPALTSHEKELFAGSAGAIEVLRERLQNATPRGLAMVAHPHPLYGGNMNNKVAQTLARAFVQSGWETVRFNFRGVGLSKGEYDEGRGELEDTLALIAHYGAPYASLAVAGFSFGAYVASHAVVRLWNQRTIEKIVLVGTATTRFTVAPLPSAVVEQGKGLVLHGADDEVIPLADVLDWAAPQNLPITVIPKAGHFFHGQLPLLKNVVLRHLALPNP